MNFIAIPIYAGGANSKVGKVDHNGSGVPFRLWTKYTKIVVISVTISTETGMDVYGFLILFKKYSNIFTMIPPKKNVYIACFNPAVPAKTQPWLMLTKKTIPPMSNAPNKPILVLKYLLIRFKSLILN